MLKRMLKVLIRPFCSGHQLTSVGTTSLVDWLKGLVSPKHAPNGTIINIQPSNSEKVAFYNSNAAVYDHDMRVYNYGGDRVGAATVHKYLQGKENSRILDVGGGTGLLVKQLKELGPYNNADGLDPAGDMLSLGKENGLYNQIFTQYFTLDTDIEPNSYDVVTCVGAMSPGNIKGETVTKMCDIVKPGGYVVIVMRRKYIQIDREFQQLLPLINQMAKDEKMSLLEETPFDNYFAEDDGLIIVLQKK